MRRIAVVGALGLVGLLTLFIVNQVAQVVALADRLSPALGTIVLWVSVVLLAVSLGVPVYVLLRLPRVLPPPQSEQDAHFAAYLAQLKRRLRRNPHLRDHPLDTRDDIEAALALLGEKADEVTRRTALQVFVSTAVLQNGSLDAVAVLAAQSRMVLEIAKVYDQRPSLAYLVKLYANVAVNALLARQIEEIDLAEYIQPVLNATLTSAVGTAVATSGLGNLVASSLLTGSANAFLTLRVGVMTKMYCGSVVVPERSTLRRSALLAATKMVPGVASQGAKQVVSALARAGIGTLKSTTGAVARQVADTVKTTSSEVAKGMGQITSTVSSTVLSRFRRKGGGRERQDEPVDA